MSARQMIESGTPPAAAPLEPARVRRPSGKTLPVLFGAAAGLVMATWIGLLVWGALWFLGFV